MNPLSNIHLRWKKENKPIIETPQLKLRPIKKCDLIFYQNLFSNVTAMSKYLGGVKTSEETKRRFNIWLVRWDKHPFSAFAVLDKTENTVIGHAILGHGDYEGNPKKGCSEIAFVIHPDYWNHLYTPKELGGAKGKQGIGTETVAALVHYAKDLFNKKTLVPVDVTSEQQLEIQDLLNDETIHDVIKTEDKISAVFIPLASIRATSMKTNTAGYRILQNLFVDQHKGTVHPLNQDRDLFRVYF